MRTLIRKSCPTFWPALGLISFTAGCDAGAGEGARAEIVRRGSQAISESVMRSLNGVYGPGCTHRSGAWSLAIANGATLDFTALSVIKDDVTCTLAITQLEADLLYDAIPPIALGSSYNAVASAFVPDGVAGPLPASFYANGKMNPADFSKAFVVTFLYSQDPSLASADDKASYDEVQAAFEGDGVSAPDYDQDVNISVKIDVHDVVTKANGSVDLTDGTTTGEAYVIDLGTLPSSPSFAIVDLAFNAGIKIPITGADPSIDAAAFFLLGATLPVKRNIILQHMESGVPSYQVITINFNLP